MTICTIGMVFLQSQEEYDDRAEEGPVDNDGYNGDGRSVFSSSDTGDMENYEVSSVVDLDTELQAIKLHQRQCRQDGENFRQDQHPQDSDSRVC